MPAKGGECDGTLEDIMGIKKLMNNDGNTTLTYNKSLIGGLERAIDLYYNREPNSVKENPADLIGFSVSPSPATDFIEIDLTRWAPLVKWSPSVEISIYNVLGEIQTTPSLRDTPPWKGGEKVKIDVSGLAPGVYFVRIGDKVSKFLKL